MNTMTDLVSGYTEAEALLSDMISHGNEQLQQARKAHDSKRVFELRVRQRDLYAQRAHVQLIAAQLRNYYAHSSQTGIE